MADPIATFGAQSVVAWLPPPSTITDAADPIAEWQTA